MVSTIPDSDWGWTMLDDKVRAMTIGEFLDTINHRWQVMEKVLGVILANAAEFYDDYDYRIGEFALALGLNAVKADGIDKDTAAAMVHNMGMLAYFMLDAETDWSPDTVARLKVIISTNPEAVACDSSYAAA
jgi:hypothetical protein